MSSERRQTRTDGGRGRQVLVKLTEEQFADVAAAATAAGMSRPAFLAWRGCQPADAARPTNLPQLRAWVAELYAIKRILRGSANNINTAVRAGHVTGELEQEALHHADRIARMEERLAELLDAVGPELKPRR